MTVQRKAAEQTSRQSSTKTFPSSTTIQIGFDRNHARRGDDLSGPDIELSVVKIALDDVAFDIAFRQRAWPVGAGVVGHKELAVDVEHREDQVVFLNFKVPPTSTSEVLHNSTLRGINSSLDGYGD